MLRVLVHGSDDGLEAALRARAIEPARDGDADALLTIGPRPVLWALAEIPPNEWKARFREWVEDPFWVFQTWLREVLERGASGRWVAITTTLGVQPFPGGGPDGAFAMAVHTLVRIAAIEYAPRGIRANAVAAGWREQTMPAELDPELARADTPTGRLTSDADIAATICWLLSDDADQLSGEVLRVDGGYTITRGSRPDPRR